MTTPDTAAAMELDPNAASDPTVLTVRCEPNGSARAAADVEVHTATSAGRLRAAPMSLPFLDGSFGNVELVCSAAALADADGERAAREIERVVRPDGCYAFAIAGSVTATERRRILRTLDDAGVSARQTPGDGLRLEGRRLAGVDAATWSTLAHGREATAWNDSMFRFQQTPYDPRTIAGRIFLRRVHWIARTIGNAPGTRVLEIGCEAGGLLRHLGKGPTIVGLDLSGAALRAARAALGRDDIAYVHADATVPLPFPDETFDAVIASEVLEHCRSPHRVVANMHRILKRDGRAIISVPNERRYLRWKHWLRRLPLARWALSGIEEGPAAWHIHHDFDRRKLALLVDGFFETESETSILGTTVISVLRKVPA